MQKLLLLIFCLTISAFGQNKTVTNADLSKFQQQRLQAEADYDKRAQRGEVPSREELEKREQHRREFLTEQTQKAAVAQNQNENYFQSQSYALRTEIAAVEAEINYVRSSVGGIPAPQTYYAVGYLPYHNNCCVGNFPHGTTQINRSQIGGSVTFGNRPQVTLSGGIGQTTIRQTGSIVVSAESVAQTPPNTNFNFGGIPYTNGILTVPFNLPTSQNLTREELLARLRILEQTRAGLYARYEILRNEAHRNGVKID